jgi:hypothetical protein
VIEGLWSGALAQTDLEAIVTYAPGQGETSVELTDFSALGNDVSAGDLVRYFDPELYPSDEYTYVISASSGTAVGLDGLMYQPFSVSTESTNDQVLLAWDSMGLDYSVDLSGSQPLLIPIAEPAVEVRWALDSDASGSPFDSGGLDRLTIAHYDALTRGELEQSFFEMEALASEAWTATLGASSGFSLRDFSSAAGEAFTGMGSSGTWVLTGHCASCADGVPPVIAFLEACAP